MPRTHQGSFVAAGLRFAIVASRFNSFVTEKLVEGALDVLVRHGAADADIDVYWVPGTFELAPTARKIAAEKKHDAIVALGALIRGGTPHFDHLSAAVTKGIADVAMESAAAVTYGVLTCDTVEQAIDRAGLKAGNKGAEAALAAVETANLLRQLK